MSQHDMDIANASGSAVRADLNLALGALVTNSSGAAAPATTFAYMWWADTTSGWLKQRDAANAAWILRMPLGTNGVTDIASAATLDLTSNTATSANLRVTGTTTTTAITLADGQVRLLRAAGAWPIAHSANLICPGAANYTCAANDVVMAMGWPGNVVRLSIFKADGTSVVSSGGGVGTVVQTVRAELTTTGTGTTDMFWDDTIPQITEGDEILTCSVTPQFSTSKLLVQAELFGGEDSNTSASALMCALFRDSTANAIVATGTAYQANDQFGTSIEGGPMRLSVWVDAGSTAATTFRLRGGLAGPGAGSAFRWNGANGGRRLGGALVTSITVQEIRQ